MSTAARALLAALALTWSASALPQDSQYDEARLREMQRSSAERDRQSDAFALQLLQQQRELLAPPGTLAPLQDLHAAQRRDFDRMLEEQRTAERGVDAVTWGPRLDTRPQMERERRDVLIRSRRESEGRLP